VVACFQSSFWLVWGIIGTLVFFQFTGTLGGWTLAQVLLVVGMFRIFEGVIDGVMRPNITRIVEHIQRGTLDFVLLKPGDSQFMASLRQLNLLTLPDFAVGLGLIGYGLWMQRLLPGPRELLGFVLLLACGVVIAYSLWMLLTTTAFWLVRIENVAEVLTAIGTGLRITLTFVIPIAFMTTFPAAALLGTLDAIYFGVAPVLALLLLLATRAFWRRALRSYTSASS
jgi:ABC-2 type transport system permease protein